MALTLTITDNGDDTGATATVAGSASGSANTIYTQRIDGEVGATFNDWTSSGSRTGNGTVSLSSLEAGHYFAHVSNNNAGAISVSPVVYATVTTGVESIHYRCAVACQSRIRLLSLAGIPNSAIHVRKVPVDREIKQVAVVLSTFGIENQPPASGTNVRDDVGYPVLCSIIFPDEHTLKENHETLLKWREQINRAFRNQRLPGVPEVIYGTVQPAQIVDLPAWLIGRFHSSLILRFTSRETRGI